MAIGKNKQLSKGSRKGGKKKVTDPFNKKEWYDVKVPNCFNVRVLGKTFVNRSQGTKLAKDALKGRVFEAFHADLNKADEIDIFRKFKLKCEDVQGADCWTNFHGMSITTDKLRSLVRKWQSLIEAHTEVKTTDGYVLRMFCIGFTKKARNTVKKTAYAQAHKIRLIRKKMVDVMRRQCSEVDLRTVVMRLQADTIGNQITTECKSIFQLRDVLIRKVKVVKAPKMEAAKLLEFYNETAPVVAEAAGVPVTPAQAAPAKKVKA
jgi:small subunit ribosomal protein S3Ae